MEQQTMTLTAKQQDMFDKWTKEQIYEAFLLENKKAIMLNKEVNRVNRLLAEIKYMAGGR